MRSLCCIALVLALFSCKEETAEPEDLGLDYFPVATGTWVEYDVDSVVYDDFNQTIDTFRFQVREVIESEFDDLEGRPTQRIERFRRNADTLPWQLTDVYTANRNNQRAERVEENIREVKLAFPTRISRTWDANAFNTRSETDYEYLSVDEVTTINSLDFDQALTVLQFDNSNLIEESFSLERYARGVGLIYKEFRDIDLQADSGLDLRMWIRDYGN